MLFSNIILAALLLGMMPRAFKLSEHVIPYILFALLGGIIGAFLVFGDAPFLLKYGRFFQPQIMSILGAALFVYIGVLIERKQR